MWVQVPVVGTRVDGVPVGLTVGGVTVGVTVGSVAGMPVVDSVKRTKMKSIIYLEPNISYRFRSI